MPHAGSIRLPRVAVVPVAIAAARRSKVIAIVFGVLCATCLFLGVADFLGGSSDASRDDEAAVFWVAAFGVACVFAARRARRLTAAANRAAADVGSTWTLADKLVVASDDRGRPVVEHSFKVTRGQTALLMADLARADERSI